MLRVRKGKSRDKTISFLQTDGCGDTPSDSARLVSLLAALPDNTRVYVSETDYPMRTMLGFVCPSKATFRTPAGGWGEWR